MVDEKELEPVSRNGATRKGLCKATLYGPGRPLLQIECLETAEIRLWTQIRQYLGSGDVRPRCRLSGEADTPFCEAIDNIARCPCPCTYHASERFVNFQPRP
jgi:hypothetical protein